MILNRLTTAMQAQAAAREYFSAFPGRDFLILFGANS
jgi:hypothetical protein